MTGCVEVTTSRTKKGYGQTVITIGRNSRVGVYAHRIAFEQAWGVVLRSDQVVRHTCDNPPCVNPLHLMVGTQVDNVRDMHNRERQVNWNATKTHCINGHEFTDSNTSIRPEGWRRCRTCASHGWWQAE